MRPSKHLLTAPALFAPLFLLAACSGVPKRLVAGDPQVRALALDDVLRSDGKTRLKMAARLARILACKNSPYRAYAASELEDLGQSAAPAVPQLLAALTDSDPDISSSAGRALAKLDAAVPALLAALNSKDPALRREAAHLLPAHGALAAAGLAKNLGSKDASLAEVSARLLGQIGPAARGAVPPLARAAFSGENELKILASAALVSIGPPAGEWLAAAVSAREPKIRAGGARVLSQMQPPSPEAAAALAAALADPDPAVRSSAAKALAAYPLGTQMLFPEDFISALFRAALAPDEETRRWAAITLARVGAPAGKWLAYTLKARDAASRAGAAQVIARLSPPPKEAAQAVLEALKDSDIPVSASAAQALGNYAALAPEALPKNTAAELARTLDSGNPALRAAVIFPLGRLAARNKTAFAALLSALKGRDLEVKKSAAAALGALGRAARPARAALWRNLKSRDCALRSVSARSLAEIEPALKRNREVAGEMKRQCGGAKAAPRQEPKLPAAR